MYQKKSDILESNAPNMAVLSEDRKEQIREIIFQDILQQEVILSFSIQEIIFSLRVYNYFNDKISIRYYKKNYEVLKKILISKIRNLDRVYLTIENRTQFPFLNMGSVDIYSDENIAKEAMNFYKTKYRDLSVKQVSIEKDNVFATLFCLGVEHLRIDMGRYSIDIELEDIFDIPFQDARLIINPKLRFAMIDFLQESYWEGIYKAKQTTLLSKEEIMLRQIKKSTYLVPVQLSKNRPDQVKEEDIKFSVYKNKEGTSFIPIFTDWFEFEKNYNKAEWQGLVTNLDKIKLLSKHMEGVVINPSGENVYINQDELI